MIKYLIFDINDDVNWDSTNATILNAIVNNDPTTLATQYSGKIINFNQTLCAMSIDITNSVVYNAITQQQRDELIVIEPSDPNWNYNL